MKGVRRLLLVVPVLLLIGCAAESDGGGGGGTRDAGPDRTRDMVTDQTVDLTIDSAADPAADLRPDVTPDVSTDPVVDPVADPRPDVTPDQTADPVTDPVADLRPDPTPDLGGGDFDECIPGFLSGGATSAYGINDEYGTYILYVWDDDDTDPTMVLVIEVDEYYEGPMTPGTYPIGAADADYSTCGLCVRAITDTAEYMPVPNSGSVTISQITQGDSVVGSTFSGSLDLTLQEVQIDEASFETTPVSGGCTGELSHSFNETVQAYE